LGTKNQENDGKSVRGLRQKTLTAKLQSKTFAIPINRNFGCKRLKRVASLVVVCSKIPDRDTSVDFEAGKTERPFQKDDYSMRRREGKKMLRRKGKGSEFGGTRERSRSYKLGEESSKSSGSPTSWCCVGGGGRGNQIKARLM